MSGSANVIHLDQFRGPLSHSTFSQVDAYWQSLFHERGDIPQRADINPRGIETALEYTFILERIAPGLARYRLAGMHLVDLIGMELRGMPFSTLFTAEARPKIADALETTFKEPQICDILLTSSGGMTRPNLTAGLKLFPLKSDLGDVSRILGCLRADGRIGRTPRQFDVQSVHSVEIKGQKTAPVLQRTESAPQSASGFSEAAKPFDGKPYLQLVSTPE